MIPAELLRITVAMVPRIAGGKPAGNRASECCKAFPAGLLRVTEATVSRIAGGKPLVTGGY